MRQPMPAAAASAAATPAVASRQDAEKLVAHLLHVMHSMFGLIEDETALARAGRLFDVARLEPRKAELTRLYIADAAQVKASSALLGRELPALVVELKRWHETFAALLQTNVTVLATAHAVSEGIIRGVAGELARKAAPRTYGKSGRPNLLRPGQIQPVAISRTL